MNGIDLIPTIEDDDKISYKDESSDSDSEAEMPRKKLKVCSKDFMGNFKFCDSYTDYNQDTWDNLKKLIRKPGQRIVDDKIDKIRDIRDAIQMEEGSDEDEEEIQPDQFKYKVGKGNRAIAAQAKYAEDDKLGTVIEDGAESSDDDANYDDTPVVNETDTFYQMNLSRPLMKAITTMNFIHPTAIQAAAIPVALLGRDIYGCASTGTGKTAAFMLPTLERLLFRPVACAVTRVLVLIPTRELGIQVYQVSRQLAQFTNIEISLAVGGLDIKHQEAAIRRVPDILIATPGRLIDHLHNTPSFHLEDLEVLILDEADRMLDENFADQMKEIIKQTKQTRQTMLFSATMTDVVKDLVSVSLKKPMRIFVNSNTDVAFNLKQEFVKVKDDSSEQRSGVLVALLERSFAQHTLVFIQTRKEVHRLYIILQLMGVKVAELRGDLPQPQRLESLRKFKQHEVDVMLCTDIAARGLDIEGVRTVINFRMPGTMKHYIHRVGRTARAGKGGRSVSIVGEGDRKLFKEIVKKARHPVKNRILPPDAIARYKDKITELQKKVSMVLQEEKVEKELRKAEKMLADGPGRIEKGLARAGIQREWFQTKQERAQKKKENKEHMRQKLKARRKKEKKREEEDPVEKEISREAGFHAREVKRKTKVKRITVCGPDDDDKERTPRTKKSRKKPKSTSKFADRGTKSLTDTRKSSVNKLRRSGNDMDSNPKHKSSSKGGKFKSKSKFKRK